MSAPCPVFGFVVELEMSKALSFDQMRDVVLAFARHVIEPRGLTYDERSDENCWTYIVRSEASQATEADRLAVDAWAREQIEIETARIGPLLDFASAA